MKNKIRLLNPSNQILASEARIGIGNQTEKFFKAFGYAFNGMLFFFRNERNASLHLMAAIAVIICGIVFQISTPEWLAIILSISIVISFEMLNSAIEKLCDLVEPQFHPTIKTIKDISAAAVLWVSMGSIAVAAYILLPKIF